MLFSHASPRIFLFSESEFYDSENMDNVQLSEEGQVNVFSIAEFFEFEDLREFSVSFTYIRYGILSF